MVVDCAPVCWCSVSLRVAPWVGCCVAMVAVNCSLLIPLCYH